MSVADDGTQGNGVSTLVSISADGRYVAFGSDASNLVPGDTNGMGDIFVYDRQTDTIERVSIASDGTQGNGGSAFPSISADGRYVAFSLVASNLVPDDTNGGYDIFVYDRQTDTIERVSLASDGTQGNGSSYSPRSAPTAAMSLFSPTASNLVPGDTNGKHDVFVYDRQTDTIERVSVASDGTQGNGNSYYPSISADGRYVAFCSHASNLVPGDTNGATDIFVYDRQTDTIERVSVAADGTQGNQLRCTPHRSAPTAATWHSTLTPATSSPAIPMATSDIFVYDRQTDTIERVSLAADGTQGKQQFKLALDQRRRPLCGVSLSGQQPRPRRYQWRQRHLRV